MGIEWSIELADELHKPIRKKFKKRRVFVSGTDAIWAVDLVELSYKYILLIIDVFTKYEWAIPLNTKIEVGSKYISRFMTKTTTTDTYSHVNHRTINTYSKRFTARSSLEHHQITK